MCVLNFASAKQPGGGWSNGAMAQEESLCYASNLFASLETQFWMYKCQTENLRLGLYSNNIICSKGVTIFKDDENYEELERPKKVDILTCATVNLLSTRRRSAIGERVERAIMSGRVKRIISVAKLKELIL